MKLISLALALIVWSANVLAHDSCNFRLIDSANAAYCRKDVTSAIKYLEQYSQTYPQHGNTLLVNHSLGRLYIQQENYCAAEAVLTRSLPLKPRTCIIPTRDKENCALFRRDDYSPVKADICVTLSELYQRLGAYGNALYYLDLADEKYLPYRDCGNGVRMYKGYLSLKYADVYLAMRDTAKALSRLQNFYLAGEDWRVAVTYKLKQLLLQWYSQQQITAAVDKAIAGLITKKLVRDGYKYEIHLFTLFGHTEQFEFDDRQKVIEHLKMDRSLKLLKNGSHLLSQLPNQQIFGRNGE